MLKHGADVNARDNFLNTPLVGAVKGRHLEIVRLLVEPGANLDAKDEEGRTAFHVAAEYGYHDIAKMLSSHGSE